MARSLRHLGNVAEQPALDNARIVAVGDADQAIDKDFAHRDELRQASKGALDTLTRNTAFGLLKNRIRVNGLNIGWMASDGEDRIQREFHGAGPDWLALAEAKQPMGMLVKPWHVAGLASYLLSDASGVMTGAMVDFDQNVTGAYGE